MTNANKTTLVSIYQFAKMMGKPAQYFYAMHREGKIPENLLEYDDVSQKPYLKLEETQQWFANRVTTTRGQVGGMPVDQILSLLIQWFEQAGKKDLSEALKKVQEDNNAEEGVDK